MRRFVWLLATLLLSVVSTVATAKDSDAPLLETGELESWRASRSLATISEFVARVTDEASDEYVAPADRIAVFDNDGTLWTEQPAYSQLLFALDTARAQVEANPELAEQSPWREVVAGDREKLFSLGRAGLLDLVLHTHAGVSETAFGDAVRSWLSEARHPTLERPFTQTVYQPMLELLDHLRAHDFTIYIVSGGGVSFLRAWAEDVYGVPPQRVLGSRVALEYRVDEGEPSLFRLAEIAHVNDGPGKPVGIQQVIGKRPILAVGNSDGDFEMLEWTTSGPGARLGVLVHHTDDEREVAYDRQSSIGHLERGLDEAKSRGWVIIDMKSDWARVFGDE